MLAQYSKHRKITVRKCILVCKVEYIDKGRHINIKCRDRVYTHKYKHSLRIKVKINV